MTTSIQKMQSNDLLGSATSPFHFDLQSQINMLYALTQQQIPPSSPSDLKIKRIKKSNDLPTQVPFISATDSPCLNPTNDREVIKVVTTAGPQCVDKEFLNHLLTRKDVIPARKRRDFIPNDMKDDHYWERRRKNNLAAKRSREKRRLNDIVLETKVVELSNENEALKAKLTLMLSRVNMKETEMENLFEEEQRLGHICLKPATSASTILGHYDDEHSSSDEQTHSHDNAIDLSRTEIKTGNLLTPSPSPQNESLLQILANQMFKTKQQESLLTLASPIETKPNISLLKRNINQLQQDNEQAAMTLLSLNKPPSPTEQQVAFQSVINSLLRKPNPPKPTIDYQNSQGENFHHPNSFDQWKTLMNYFSTQQPSSTSNPPRSDMMPLKLRMKMLHGKS